MRARKVLGPYFDDRVIMNEVTETVKTGTSITLEEVQACRNFLWNFFDSIPKLKKYYFGDKVS